MPSTQSSPAVARRRFLQGAVAAGGALTLGVTLNLGSRRAVAAATGPAAAGPDAFVRIAQDDTVTILIKHLEMGQGVSTGLTTLVAEELDADWPQMRFEPAPSNPMLYANLLFPGPPIQATGGSSSIANSYEQMRRAGAAARAMLVSAAAAEWAVPTSEITVSKGVISHKSGKKSGFGAFAAKAAAQPVPEHVNLKDPKNFVLIGTVLPRLDSPAKTDGTAIFSMDIRRPGMRTAVIARPDRFGGKVKSVDATAAKAVSGVVDVVTIPQGVAVIATNTYAAIKGREALKLTFDDSAAETRSTDKIFADYRALTAKPGRVAKSVGDAGKALKTAAKIIEADFEMPYLAHAPMEPLNCVIEKKPDGSVEMWSGAQLVTGDHFALATALGVPMDRVKLHVLAAGGSFGRRATLNSDHVVEAAEIVKATNGKYPVHLVRTREDDIKGGHYRPAFYHKVRVGLDQAGKLVAWEHHLVGQSVMDGTSTGQEALKGNNAAAFDDSGVEGLADTPYALPNFTVDWHRTASPVTTLWWRSVGHSHTAHIVESCIDEAAHAAGADPVAFRMELLKEKPRHRAVLALAAAKSGFAEKLPPGQGRGIALHESFNSIVAMVAEVRVAPDGTPKVTRVVVAVDCGVAVNPDVIKAQMEGGVGFALGAALRDKITLTDGRIDQANFDSYEPLRIGDMPVVEVHIVPSSEAPTGVGEPGVPPLAPAVANAIFAASGKRMRSLPFLKA